MAIRKPTKTLVINAQMTPKATIAGRRVYVSEKFGMTPSGGAAAGPNKVAELFVAMAYIYSNGDAAATLSHDLLKVVRSKEVHFCLPFARGASSSYICVATVVLYHS